MPPRGLARFYRPGGGVLLVFIGLGGGGFELFFSREWGIRPLKKLPAGMVRLGID